MSLTPADKPKRNVNSLRLNNNFLSVKTYFSCRKYINDLIAREISKLTRYFDSLVQFKPRDADTLILLDLIDSQNKRIAHSISDLHDISGEINCRTAVLLNGNLNYDFDIEHTLATIHDSLSRSARLIAVVYNPYFGWLYQLANRLGIRKGANPQTFVTVTTLENFAKLAGYQIVRLRLAVVCPFRLFGIGDFINRIVPAIPILRWMSLAAVVVFRPIKGRSENPSLTIVIPARNEKGNIENAITRMPQLPCSKLEIIFVEGHSTDNTWEEIQSVLTKYKDRYNLQAFQQQGVGKADAARLGLSYGNGDLLTILDADLTMPPELLGRFYEAYCKGLGDFINGSRLVYPMEGQAMRFLNRLGNIFFAKALSLVLETPISDSLCGTKLFTRHDYERMKKWRDDFGDFDPFGDYELLFPAAEMGLGIVDVAIRYRDRTYGTTKISRFRHGLMLLKMTTIGLLRIKLGTGSGKIR